MKKILLGVMLFALIFCSGCYFGVPNMGEMGIYYAPPYSRTPAKTPEWIQTHRVDYYSHPQSYAYWY